MAIVGIGTDIVKIERIARAINRKRFLDVCYTADEIEYCKRAGKFAPLKFAGYFAAKESVAKALGVGFLGFYPRDIEICHDEMGCPKIKLSAKVKIAQCKKIWVSISHEKEFATAVAIIEV